MNNETKPTNFFQKEKQSQPASTIQAKALLEFDALVIKLETVGVQVIVVNDTQEFDTPDAIFPNNWISFHYDGTVAIYPMLSNNRRKERREDILNILEKKGFLIENVVDYSTAEQEGFYLEGTGSLVLDRVHQKAYAAISPRTDEELAIEFCEDFEYTPVFFTANQTIKNKRVPIYHTNVLFCVASTFTVVCLDAIDDKKERKQVVKHLKSNGKEIVVISQKQMQSFAGNMLEVLGENSKSFLVMSTNAFVCLTAAQRTILEKHSTIIHSDLQTIETYGGGSARCMLAEVFLPKQ